MSVVNRGPNPHKTSGFALSEENERLNRNKSFFFNPQYGIELPVIKIIFSLNEHDSDSDIGKGTELEFTN